MAVLPPFSESGETAESTRRPLVVRTVVMRHEPPGETGEGIPGLSEVPDPGSDSADLFPPVGTRLGLCPFWGSPLAPRFGLLLEDEVIYQFGSRVVAGLLERGEPLAAVVSAVSGDQNEYCRVEVFINRPVQPGEVLPLLPARGPLSSVALQLTDRDYGCPPGEAGWHPLRMLPWHRYLLQRISSQPTSYYHCEDLILPMLSADRDVPHGLLPIEEPERQQRKQMPWRDLEPGAVVLNQPGGYIGYIPEADDPDIEQLLAKGERVEAEIFSIARLCPAAYLVRLRLVA